MARIFSPTSENIRKAVALLRNHEVIGLPTETVYGLAGRLSSIQALAKIFAVKERPTFDPLITHVALEKPRLSELNRWNLVDHQELSDRAIVRIDLLMKAFWPGPLTLVLPRTDRVPDLATSGLPEFAVRMPSHPVALELIRNLGEPVCAPSANRFGRISPTEARHVEADLGERIAMILEGGPCTLGIESTIVRIQPDGGVSLLRRGSVSIPKIEKVIGDTVPDAPKEAVSPGRLDRHYSPDKPSYFTEVSFLKKMEIPGWVHALPAHLGFLCYQGHPDELKKYYESYFEKKVEIRVLSPSGESEEAARNLFRCMRELEKSPAETLFLELPPNDLGLNPAIRDRLQRAGLPLANLIAGLS